MSLTLDNTIEILTANAQVFTQRFPNLAKTMGLSEKENCAVLLKQIPENYRLENTRQLNPPAPTLRVNGKYLHSKYNPLREAEQTLQTPFFSTEETEKSCCFLGLGLGYTVELFAKKHPSSSILIIEPDIFIFILFLASRPLQALLRHERLSILPGTPAEDAAFFINDFETDADVGESHDGGMESVSLAMPMFNGIPAQEVSAGWFKDFAEVKKRILSKEKINAATLKRFGLLWLKNTVKNIPRLPDLPSIAAFKNRFKEQPCLIIAGGPSLDELLPKLAGIQKNCLVIAVDTALKACVRVGIEPHFLLVFDPQYWNFLHIAGTALPNTVLVTNTNVFPAVLRLSCKGIFLSASSVPLGQYFEKQLGICDALAEGGSVATSAWDFAAYLGARNIVFAGLDLAFPKKQTHFKGSTFEERTHLHSFRTCPAETEAYKALYASIPEYTESYTGEKVLSGKAYKLYSWWFENRSLQDSGIKTYNLEPQGMKITGIHPLKFKEFEAMLSVDTLRQHMDTIIEACIAANSYGAAEKLHNTELLLAAKKNLNKELLHIINIAKEIILFAEQARQKQDSQTGLPLLTKKERVLEQSFAKNILSSLFFITASNTKLPYLEKVLDTYTCIRKAAEQLLYELKKNY
ncbi:DUF115 domain-containing protein [Treponema phagedenis]|uniref:Motility associated factor glycosyltransferase family protein n=1 Tax=Treponema phagedenis TaxID=162 RepID=A0A0B7H1C4_TREPH|nr:6-hydroxymethylpterin diphosphokinase MptE-like protein [Treponema phagedenis]NVP23027.1 motility associated factor glycosyltransferase family protein [Treponema phagedenis]QEJ98181.1 motility associated factor glycosyltransferase family protein [Treponema phagedenis]QEK01072.1 motility associated factor glycosyltransferase family protein [Treponema phagedenis]QEK03688.1 motility associated factor glycosyltransferase family protein [Treponema phagedenis]QEK06080.1 motility associated factor